jgi:hypothetical protein
MFLGLFTFDVANADEELQTELIDIQYDSIFRVKFWEVIVPNIYSLLPRDQFPKFAEFAYQICATFDSTYMYEQLFSLMKRNKIQETLRLMDKHLSSIMKVIPAQNLKPNIHTPALLKIVC